MKHKSKPDPLIEIQEDTATSRPMVINLNVQQTPQSSSTLDVIEAYRQQPEQLVTFLETLCSATASDQERECLKRALQKLEPQGGLRKLLELHAYECLIEQVAQHALQIIAPLIPEATTLRMLETRHQPEAPRKDN